MGGGRAGWYLQQLLKLSWAYKTEDPYYIVIDADTIPLNHLDFVTEDGRFLFTRKIEYNKPYFDTIETLFDGNLKRIVDFSFIAEHMVFSTNHVKHMLSMIEENNKIKGKKFWEKILYSINPKDIEKSGFSEFETYGNFMFKYYPELVEPRKIRTEREAVYLIGSSPSKKILDWASRDYDVISIESLDYKKTLITSLSSMSLIRRLLHLRTIAKWRRKIRSIYRKLLRKADFKFEDS